jgi:NAD(P)-dependent dehydrogenase (short-subunit alcohol dehydrogenase family)
MRALELFDLSGKTALVTGGGRGIGRFIAIGLAEAGAHVGLASRKILACEQAAAEIRDAGGRADAFEADVASPESIDRLVTDALGVLGRIDILVNNAAVVWAAPTLDYPLSGWDRVFDVNVRGLFYLSQQVARHMKESGGGSVIHVGSISAWRGDSDEDQPVIAYNASKGAVASLTIDMAVKLASHGIRVNSIAPGPFMTDMMSHISSDEERLSAYNAGRPLGRSGEEDDIKGAAVFLASDASAYMTGQTLVVDGGTLLVGS